MFYFSNICVRAGVERKQKGGSDMFRLNTNLARFLDIFYQFLKKRTLGGELVIIPTDKSGNMAVVSRDNYMKARLKHTLGDREVDWDIIMESQREINGHVTMLIKFFKTGYHWDHGSTIRETTIGEGMSICPLSLLFKDHKGWTSYSGTVPPTRPVQWWVATNYEGDTKLSALKTWWHVLRFLILRIQTGQRIDFGRD